MSKCLPESFFSIGHDSNAFWTTVESRMASTSTCTTHLASAATFFTSRGAACPTAASTARAAKVEANSFMVVSLFWGGDDRTDPQTGLGQAESPVIPGCPARFFD